MGCFYLSLYDPQISQITQITLKTLRLCARILSTDFTDNSDYDVRLSGMSLYPSSTDFTDSVRLSRMS